MTDYELLLKNIKDLKDGKEIKVSQVINNYLLNKYLHEWIIISVRYMILKVVKE